MIIGIIPARFASSRFPGKPLADIGGKTMIQRVYEQAQKSTMLDRIFVATDDDRIASAVQGFGGEVRMTRGDHPSGTDRCAEVVKIEGFLEDDVIVNIQGDEPFIAPEQIDTLCTLFQKKEVQLATLYKSFAADEESLSPNSIKLVTDIVGRALYFSRSTIPFLRSGEIRPIALKQHIGIYGYRVRVLIEISNLEPSKLEQSEMLEQLRWLENGYTIHTARSEFASHSIDTPEDLKKVIEHFGL